MTGKKKTVSMQFILSAISTAREALNSYLKMSVRVCHLAFIKCWFDKSEWVGRVLGTINEYFQCGTWCRIWRDTEVLLH